MKKNKLSYSEYQREYRSKNKEKAKNYQKQYRAKQFNEERIKLNLSTNVEKERSRIYVCKIGDDRLKIGATHIESNRTYHLKRKINLLGMSFVPLYYFDCRNKKLIGEIESNLKKLFCSQDIGINLNSFKNEVTHIENLDKIYFFIENKLKDSGLEYSIISE